MKLVLDDSTFITAYERSGMRSFGVSPTARAQRRRRRRRSRSNRGWASWCRARSRSRAVAIVLSREGHAHGHRRGTLQRAGSAPRAARRTCSPAATTLMTRVSATPSATRCRSRRSSLPWRRCRPPRSTCCAPMPRRWPPHRPTSPKRRCSSALKAIEIDKNFGLGYLMAANQSGNLGRSDDERKYLELAMQHLDGMTDRERYHAADPTVPGDQRLPAVRQGIQ